MKQILSIITLTIVSLSINSCTTSKSEDVENAKTEANEANEKLAKAKKAYQEDVVNYRAEISAQIQANDLLITKMKAENNGTDKTVSLERERKINELERKNNELSIKMKNYKGEDEKGWYNFKQELKHDMVELSKSFQDVSKDNVADKK